MEGADFKSIYMMSFFNDFLRLPSFHTISFQVEVFSPKSLVSRKLVAFLIRVSNTKPNDKGR